MNSIFKKFIGKKIINMEYVDIGHGPNRLAPLITLEDGIEIIVRIDAEGNFLEFDYVRQAAGDGYTGIWADSDA
jgi:hypothetical protein